MSLSHPQHLPMVRQNPVFCGMHCGAKQVNQHGEIPFFERKHIPECNALTGRVPVDLTDPRRPEQLRLLSLRTPLRNTSGSNPTSE